MIDVNADPWSWPEKLEPGEALLLSEASDFDDPNGKLCQYRAVLEVRSLRPLIEAGNGPAVMDAVYECAMRGLHMPDWLAMEFIRRYRAVHSYQAKGWNAENSFGEVHQPGAHLKTKRLVRKHSFRIHRSVVERMQEGEPQTTACEALEIEISANPEDWEGWNPGAKTIERIYKVEKAYWDRIKAWAKSPDKFQKNSV